MKKSLVAGVVLLSMLLCGCSSLLARDYVHISAHNTTPTAEGDPSILRAESYQELVNALVYFINQGMETGSIRLYNDSENAEADLEAACLEVVQEDPLGAYAVDYIKYSVNSIVTYYEADVQITYRRTRDQMDAIVSATGAAAIRTELKSALANFDAEQVLRISYFDQDEAYIRALCQEAYYANPATALDFPDISVAIYPDSGQLRIVELLLSYHLEPQELVRRRELLALAAQELTQELRSGAGDEQILAVARAVLDAGGYQPTSGSTPYHALLDGGADSQGLALAVSLLCQKLDLPCQVVVGTLGQQPHFWVVVSTDAGWRHLELTGLSTQDNPFQTDEEMRLAGYDWNPDALPAQTQSIKEVQISLVP